MLLILGRQIEMSTATRLNIISLLFLVNLFSAFERCENEICNPIEMENLQTSDFKIIVFFRKSTVSSTLDYLIVLHLVEFL